MFMRYFLCFQALLAVVLWGSAPSLSGFALAQDSGLPPLIRGTPRPEGAIPPQDRSLAPWPPREKIIFSKTELKAGIDQAVSIVQKLDPKKIERNELGIPFLDVDKHAFDTLGYLEKVKSTDAIPHLVPWIDVRFKYLEPGVKSKVFRYERSADNALKATGLPAVDHILTIASESKLDKTKAKAARQLCVDILGEDGLRARVQFLKLGKDDKVKSFVEGK